jgi:hypothetical protein
MTTRTAKLVAAAALAAGLGISWGSLAAAQEDTPDDPAVVDEDCPHGDDAGASSSSA